MPTSDLEQDLWYRLRLSGMALAAVLCLGVLGYTVFAPDSSLLDRIYMTVVTLTTVGYGEVISTADRPGLKIFTMFFMVFGMGFLLFSVTTLTATLVEFDLSHVFRRRRMERRIADLENHYILCGAGETGTHVIEEFQVTNVPFVVVEENPDSCPVLEASGDGLLVVQGDATDEDVLRQAGIARARGLCAVLQSDKDNLFLTLTARGLNSTLRIVARGVGARVVAKLVRAGADSVVSPTSIGGLRMASELIRPHTVSFLDLMLRDIGESHRFGELPVTAGSGWTGKCIRDLPLRERQMLVVAVREPTGAFRYVPPADFQVVTGCTLIVLGRTDTVAAMRAELQQAEAP